MQPADLRLAEALAKVTIARPKIPVLSNVDAQTHDDPEQIRENLVRQVVSPVLWEDSMRAMLQRGIDEFYEIGPGRVLRGLLKRIDRKAACQTVNDMP
jgi:[acyl-carrier-protein] S-malonyltransferase